MPFETKLGRDFVGWSAMIMMDEQKENLKHVWVHSNLKYRQHKVQISHAYLVLACQHINYYNYDNDIFQT